MPSRRAAAALLPRASRSACSTCARCALVTAFGSNVEAIVRCTDSVNAGGVFVSIATSPATVQLSPRWSARAKSLLKAAGWTKTERLASARTFANPRSQYKQITKLGFGDVALYDAFVDKYLAGKVSDLKAGLQGVANEIEHQLQLGQ